jgi:23S rRNA (adenine-N6)-dimethyltransferase
VSAAPRTTWWGWHRLSDDWARLLVARAHIEPGDLVLDIGAGTGAITRHLVEAGARVLAFELHPRRADDLRRRFAGDQVTVIERDAADLRPPRHPFHVVANPPFAITTALLRRILDPRAPLQRAELIVPRHVAVRWSSGRGSDVDRWALAFDAVMTSRVPRSAFVPAPSEDAALLTIARRPFVAPRRRAGGRPRPVASTGRRAS